MSGHSKWSTIKRQKGATDQKRGQIFTKLASAITIAVRQGGMIMDPNSNFRLRLAIEKAKQANMPKDNIERAVKRGGNQGKEEMLEEIIYEGYGPYGIAIIVQAATDNRARTTAEIKNIFERAGGRLGQSGSVNFLFKNYFLILVKKSNFNSDSILMSVIDAGAQDIEEKGNEVMITCLKNHIASVKKVLEINKITIENLDEEHIPVNTVNLIEKNKIDFVLEFIEKFENLDEVLKVYHNLIFNPDLS